MVSKTELCCSKVLQNHYKSLTQGQKNFLSEQQLQDGEKQPSKAAGDRLTLYSAYTLSLIAAYNTIFL